MNYIPETAIAAEECLSVGPNWLSVCFSQLTLGRSGHC